MDIEQKLPKTLTQNFKAATKTFTIATIVISLAIFSIDSGINVSPCFTVIIEKENNDCNNMISNQLMLSYPLLSSSSSSSSFSSSRNKKLVHSSIRMEEEVFQLLQKEAERQGISVNSLINKTLKNYVKSEMYFEQLGFLLVSKDFLRMTFSGLQDKNRLEELGRELGLTVAKEYVSYFFPKVDSSTLVQFLDIWFRRLQSYKHTVDTSSVKDINVIIQEGLGKENEEEYQQLQRKEIHYFIINHDININFSIALKAGLEGLIEPIIKSHIIFQQITSNSISFSFSLFLSSESSSNTK
jgi:hypothetical protein